MSIKTIKMAGKFLAGVMTALSLVLVFPLNVSAAGMTLPVEQQNEASIAENTTPISPRIIVTVTKEVRITYSSYDSIPETISYNEYNDTYNTWMSGTLWLNKAEKIGSTWYATFKGTLFGHI